AEAPKSLTLASWPREVRLAWHYLSMYLDDSGRGVDDPRLVLAECFPLDRDVTEKKMTGWLDLMGVPGPSSSPTTTPRCAATSSPASVTCTRPSSEPTQKINRPTKSKLPPCPIHEPDGLW
ncbi:hypothetical protein, partial [Nocardioides panaciterrulae]